MEHDIAVHERLASLETGQLYTNKTLDEVKTLLAAHTSGQCDGACGTGKQLANLQGSMKTYKKLTWASLTVIVGAGLKSLFYP